MQSTGIYLSACPSPYTSLYFNCYFNAAWSSCVYWTWILPARKSVCLYVLGRLVQEQTPNFITQSTLKRF
jgi:hypothetical protein